MTIKMAPYIQATMLMSIYFLLPWVLLVGGYEWSTIKTVSVSIFAIKFWTSIWAVVSLLDNKMLDALTVSRDGLNFWTDMINAQLGFTRIIVDLLILSLYIGLPTYFLMMLAWGGERGASQSNSAATGMSSKGDEAGKTGGKVVKTVATKGKG